MTSSGVAQCSAPMQRAVGVQRASAGGHARIVRSSPPLSVSPGPGQYCRFLAQIDIRVRLRARSQFRAGWPPLQGLSPPPVSRPVRPPLPVWPPRLQVRCGQATGLAAALRSFSRPTASFRPCFKLSRLLHPRPAPLAGVPLGARRLLLPFSRLPLSGWLFHSATGCWGLPSACRQGLVCRLFVFAPLGAPSLRAAVVRL